MNRIKEKKDIIIYGDGHQTRDFIHVKDVTAANFLVYEKVNDPYAIFNVGTGRQRSLLELAHIMFESLSVPEKISFEKERSGDIRHSVADISKLAKAAGFHSPRTLETGINDHIRHSFNSI